jgi:hypothetical protein
MRSRALLAPLLIGTWALSGPAPVVAATEPAEPPATREPYVAVADREPAATAGPSAGRPDTASSATEPAVPPTPLQTAGALGGALLAILLAIAGVTVTFRSMRKEMRRGRGRSRRPERSTLPQT